MSANTLERNPTPNELPLVNPYEALAADGMIQTLKLGGGEARQGGKTIVDLRDLDPIQGSRDGFNVDGTPADLISVIGAGSWQLGIIDTRPGEGYKSDYTDATDRFVLAHVSRQDNSPFAPFRVDKVPGTDKSAAAFMTEPDTTTVFSRDFNSRSIDEMGLQHLLKRDSKLSRKHLSFRLTEDGNLEITDEKSHNGTQVFVRPARNSRFTGTTSAREVTFEDKIFRLNYDNARKVEDDELVRKRGNNGKDLNPVYRANQEKLRSFLVDQFVTGNLYKDNQTFMDVLSEGHNIASADKVYDQVGEGSNYDDERRGQWRVTQAYNTRDNDGRFVARIAARYGDPYAQVFEKAKKQGKIMHKVDQEGIPLKDQTHDKIEFDANGKLTLYEHEYPWPDAIPLYLAKIQELGQQFTTEVQKAQPDIDKALDLIARQYQYGAIVRPFDQINNSIFMNLVNMQLKVIGFKGIPHLSHDLVAQRLQPENFSRYFVDEVVSEQK